MAKRKEIAEIIQEMLANNNIQDIGEVIRDFANNNEATKKLKCEDNLRTWKWSDVINVDALPDNAEPANVPKNEETTVEQYVVASENINVTLDTSRTYSSDQEEDVDEDESDQEEDLDEDSSDVEEYIGMFDETDQEEDLGEDDTDQDDSNDGWV
ncbi:hypothetical protein Tco_1413272 [Tanacetum coccineum]